jgi:hypothetical protein
LGRANRENDVHTKLDQFRSELRKTVLPAFRVAPLDKKGFALDVAELPQTLSERREKVRTAGWPTRLDMPYFGDPHRPSRRKRPRSRRAAEHRDELAALHSITSSARASSVAGTSRPSAFAVLRLMISSYFVGACTGRSAGFSPLRIRSM